MDLVVFGIPVLLLLGSAVFISNVERRIEQERHRRLIGTHTGFLSPNTY